MALNVSEPAASHFYVAGGTLQRDARCYVTRQADADLLEGLRAGQFCYVLTSRQMGKSSLMVRTAERLKAEGVSVAILDLTAFGKNLSPEQWYDLMLNRVGRQLHLEDELDDFWQDNKRVAPMARFFRALREVVLNRQEVKGTRHELQAASPQPSALSPQPSKLVIFVDEVDIVRSLPFSADEFFAGIRECYNARAEDPAMQGLTFCLLGVATPSDLIQDVGMTPFNIGRRIELRDFTPEEAAPLGVGCRVLGVGEKEAQRLIARILHWTGGHPYMTQRLCQALVETQKAEGEKGSKGEGESPLPESPTPYTLHPTPSLVDRHCEALFLSSQARQADDHLLFVRRRMLESGADVAGVLDLYGKVRAGKRVPDDETNPLVSVLRLSGIARSVGGLLEVRNRIYAHVFDTAWIAANSPDAELRRQRAAFRRGLIGTVTVLGTIMFVMGWVLAFKTLSEKRRANEQARRYQQASEKAQSEAQRADENANLARQSAQQAQVAAGKEHQEKMRADKEMNKAKSSARRADAEKINAKIARDHANAVAQQEKKLRNKHQTLSSKIYKVSSRYFNVKGDEGEGAEGYYTAQLEYFTLLNKTSEIAASLLSLGNFYSKRQKYGQAENYYLQAMSLYQKIGNKQKIAESLTSLGDIHNYQEHFAMAKHYYTRALLLYESLRPKSEIGSLCNKLGEVCSRLHQWNEARDHFVRAYALAIYYDEKQNLRRTLADVYTHLGQPEKAQEYYNRTR